MSRRQPMEAKLNAEDEMYLRWMMYIGPNWSRNSEWADYDILMEALKINHKKVVNFLLDRGCRVTKPGSDVYPLHLAAGKLGWYRIVEKLLIAGARVTDCDDKGDTALHVAFLSYTSDDVIDLLLERYLMETTENLCNKEGISFLHIACTRSNVEIVRDFVVRGQADVNSKVWGERSIFSGCTPLHFAAEYGQPAIIQILLENNAELYAQDLSGSTALHFALERCDVTIIDLILSYDKRYENVVNIFGLSHFMAACAGTNECLVHEFLRVVESQAKTSVWALINRTCENYNQYRFAGYNSMLIAAEFGRYQTLQFLNIVIQRESRRERKRRWDEIEVQSTGELPGLSWKFFTFVILLILSLSLPIWFLS